MEVQTSVTAAPTSARAPVDSSALSRDELSHALRRPHHLLWLVLGQRERLYASIAKEQHLWLLAGALFLGSLLYSLPFGAVLGVSRFWRIAVLFLGSLAICLPSLHVVGTFVGSRLALAQTLCLALVLSAVASLFSFGFFPIMWFLGATMQEAPGVKGGLAVGLLTVSHLRSALVVAAWLTLSLLVGSQGAWFLRPFFGVASISAEETPFFLGSRPDFRGATSFYEALWQVVAPPAAARAEGSPSPGERPGVR